MYSRDFPSREDLPSRQARFAPFVVARAPITVCHPERKLRVNCGASAGKARAKQEGKAL
jgi:hypothetical protein